MARAQEAPGQSSGRFGCGPGVKREVGVQPRCVHTAITTRMFLWSALDRYSFAQYDGNGIEYGDFDCGSATSLSALTTSASMSSVRYSTHTGLPRQGIVSISPGLSALMSTSTGAPAALALVDGAIDAAKGITVATPPTPPATDVAISHVRRPLSTCLSSLSRITRPNSELDIRHDISHRR
ncbi:hypothetical protein C7S16_4014 [Burkholderia thailandensis]|uniref:Uncharacterized protein n=1 Tax=Burkholderia thailandensis TaxID=57975 RepID=A0AAW9D2D6_BURTH|nr:hypothetical protein [Burkholderia thailandensis]